MFSLHNSSALDGIFLRVRAKLSPAISNSDLIATPLFNFQSQFERAGKNVAPTIRTKAKVTPTKT